MRQNCLPGGTSPLGHGVGLPLGRAAAAGAGGVHPVGHGRQGGLPVVGGLIAAHLGQQQGELLLRQRNPAALVAVDQGNGLPPIPLAGKDPVPELIVDLLMANSLLLQPLLHHWNGFLHRQAVEEVGVHHDPGVVLQGKGRLLDVPALDHFNDLTAKLLGKFPVPVVVGRHRHDRPGAVGHQNIVRDENRDLLSVDGVDPRNALQLHPGLFLGQLGPLKVRLPGRGLHIGGDLVPVADGVLPPGNVGVLRREHHVGGAKEGVGAGGIDDQVIPLGGGEGHLRAGGAANPVFLLNLHPLDEVHLVQVVNQALGILGDLQHPLALLLTDDLAAAALADAVDHFLVGQHALAAGTPVDGHGGLIGKAPLEHLLEDPLGPLVVAGVGGVDAAVPIETVAQHFQLAGEVGDVLLGDDGGVDMVLDGVVLRGQAEGIEADGVQNIIALHTLFTGDDIHGREGPGMAHMETLTGGVGELDEAVELLPGLVPGDSGEGLFLQPLLLPFLFNGCKIVLHG